MALIPWGDSRLIPGLLAFMACLGWLANDDINLGEKGIMHYFICNQVLNLNTGGTINFLQEGSLIGKGLNYQTFTDVNSLCSQRLSH